MSEDVSKFLLQVKELGDRRIEEDEARSRELEERILRERKEREARRAERARSISPQKSSPANTPPPSTHRIDTHVPTGRLNLDSSPIFEPPGSLHSPKTEEMSSPGEFSTSPSKENEFPVDLERKQPNQVSPTRTTRGLSWQRRPTSQASDRSRSRPLSVVAAENLARNTPPEPSPATETVSRDQIASALSSKDPSWFRQTADRGANSAAYRKNQVEDNQTADISLMPAQLPGMSRASSSETPKGDVSPPPTSPELSNRLASPLPLYGAPKLDPPPAANDIQFDTEISQERLQLMSPSSGRTSPSKLDRSGSPTKGMGGFVQSAMMKRSDSIKRWSVQSPSGAQRADPIVPNRTGYDSSNRATGGSRSRSRPASMIRDPSAEFSPKPPTSREEERHGDDVFGAEKPSDSLKIDTKPSPELQDQESGKDTPSIPVSPSKTMDSRRWSPTKSSWLESALNKPESPKPKHAPSASQPAWMAELQKAKAEKASNPSVERGRSTTVSHKHQVSIGGLMRSSAPGLAPGAIVKPAGLGVLPSPTISTNTNARPDNSVAPNDLKSPTTPDIKSPDSDRKLSHSPLPSIKSKPDAPPTKDFRAGLKPRQATITSDNKPENELQNVFSKLRRTTTQNYVAPDELKGNILKGKAALNTTGGPKKTERVDEFKEAILSKRKDFQKAQSEGRGVVVARKDSTAGEEPIPEGLIRRGQLGRSNTIKLDAAASDAIAADLEKSSTSPKPDSTQEPLFSKVQRFGNSENRDPVLGTNSSRADLPSIPRRGSAQTVPTLKNADPPSSAQKETVIPGRLQGKPGGLANRFNPALASLIARGPPTSSSNNTSTTNSHSNATSEGNDNEAASGPKLTHMTKGRARGPKRKAPTSAPTSVPTATPSEPEEKSYVATSASRPSTATQPERTPISTPKPEVVELIDSSKLERDESTMPKPRSMSVISSSAKSFEPASGEASNKAPDSPNKIHEQVAAFAAQRRQRSPTKTFDEPKEPLSQPPSPRKLDMKRMSRFIDESNQDAGNTGESQQAKDTKRDIETPPVTKPNLTTDGPASSDIPGSQPQSPPLSKPKRPLPDPIPVKPLGARPLPSAPAATNPEASPASTRPLPAEPKQVPRPLSIPAPKSPPPETSSPVRSPTKQSLDASNLLGDFFGPERTRKNYNVDAAELLMRRPNVASTGVQTLSAQLYQFSADGKKIPVPTHHERTLFEREMYICSHTFKDESGKKVTEVYFWAGDEVPRSTVDDASTFLSREAKALGGKLVKLQQGKEAPEFLQALGGIVIVQRGSGNKFDSLAPHMLCGRRYHGHVVFDEVDFTPAVLCSGFPYVVTTAGKCYLWKGKGSGVDELSCARLIGMDYALSGEMEEMEDGHEPETFWKLFKSSSAAVSADHWRLKPNYDKYCCRLFRSDAASKQQIVEMSPFSQKDLLPKNIYVLDAFFELYIIVGSRAQSQYASFHNALEFAQEYGILAAGMEDRPFVPFSTVVLEGIPRDMKSVFRKWRDADSPTVTNVNTGLKRGRSLRVVPLNQALQALDD
ncbi:uncharacterized protein GGS22DRAFT_107408 [Annulohypoxylon maeteangense]|uniref:uncharacterized protein n=1 Tax=Annulohypoxylon maeteangense TaxID=1927788 RepID=UPI0020083E90|nr:uncharacterized protein GGS22DRAFT_107408 [Annulohypoxylon maeteangense]KAI0887295.1 hypothetical protein GGS22DRAFT_107408 [Annulohypoxylon maeteangense]